MPAEEPSKIAQWVGAFREWLPAARQQGREWFEIVRAEPALVWQTPAIRYSVYGAGLIVLVLTLRWATSFISPGGPDIQPPAKTASFWVVCSNPQCKHLSVINRKFGFDSFPVECSKCKQQTGRRGLQCFSPTCGGKWVYAVEVNGRSVCAVCRRPLGVP